jgi:hypothetical protein
MHASSELLEKFDVSREAVAAVGLHGESAALREALAAVPDDDAGVAARKRIVKSALSARENPQFRKLLQTETGTNDTTFVRGGVLKTFSLPLRSTSSSWTDGTPTRASSTPTSTAKCPAFGSALTGASSPLAGGRLSTFGTSNSTLSVRI